MSSIRIIELRRQYDGDPPGDLLVIQMGNATVRLDSTPEHSDVRVSDGENGAVIELDQDLQISGVTETD